MVVLGTTRSGKIIGTNEGLSRSQLDEFYKDFTIEDHYDALSVWTCYIAMDHRTSYRNSLFHGEKAGVELPKSLELIKELIRNGRQIIYDRMSATKQRRV